MIPAPEALERLREGNRRFAARTPHTRSHYPLPGPQRPFAVILGCADSRVPPEIVFDQALGDLFVIRVAGHVVTPAVLASVEFAAGPLGARLIVTLGHTSCGAVLATLDALDQSDPDPGPRPDAPDLRALVGGIRPALTPLLETDPTPDRDSRVRRAVRANIHAATAALRRGSALLRKLAAEDGLRIVGAEYDLETGRVEFLVGC
jgi:carbonic anhydrase